jgi:hypothetical protein
MLCNGSILVFLLGLAILEAGVDPFTEEFESLSLESEFLSPPRCCTRTSGVGPTGHCNSFAITTTSTGCLGCAGSTRARVSSFVSRCWRNDGSGGVICRKKDFRVFSRERSVADLVCPALIVRDLPRGRLGEDFEWRRRGSEGMPRRICFGGVGGAGTSETGRVGKSVS